MRTSDFKMTPELKKGVEKSVTWATNLRGREFYQQRNKHHRTDPIEDVKNHTFTGK
jgi:hypothetical protein